MAITTINLSSLDGKNGFRMDGMAAGYSLGSSVSDAGDVNGDGFADVIVSAPSADPNGVYNAGSSYVVFGKITGFGATLNLSSLDGSNGFRLEGATEGDRSGLVSSAGDVNGDGFADVIVSAPSADPNGVYNAGSSFIVFGKKSGFNATMNLSILNGNNGFRIDGESTYGLSGGRNAGDINGDGFDDLIIGAGSANSNGHYSGSSYVVFGKGSEFGSTINLAILDGKNGFRMDGVAEEDKFGAPIGNAGDVNGDGFDDLLIGAIGTSHNGEFSGSSYVVFGKASRFDAKLELSSLDGSNGFRLDGETLDQSGASLSSAGDVNGDGFDDLIIGVFRVNDAQPGSSYVVFGKSSGFNATLDLSSLDGNNGFRINGAEVHDRLGDSVSNAGDINGDGFDDLLIGAPGASSHGAYSGSSYVLYGKAGGFNDVIDLSNLDINSGFRLDGAATGDNSGFPVSGAGDVNNDGFDDLLVGASGADPNGSYSGSSYVIFGRSDFGSGGNVIAGTSGDDNLIGSSAADIFDAGDGNDNLIGRGGADVFHAGAGDDNIRVSDLNFQLIDGGSGNDVLHLTGKDLNLDLSSLGDKISGIETICLYGNGDNALTVTTAGLINLSDTTNTLKVNGNAGDHIIGLSSGWVDEGVRGEGYFHAYTQGDAVLLVGANVTTDFV